MRAYCARADHAVRPRRRRRVQRPGLQLAFPPAGAGATPMQVLQRVRLDRAREELLVGEAKSVTAVAMRCGFGHLGRFAAEYRKTFGESPRDTQQPVPATRTWFGSSGNELRDFFRFADDAFAPRIVATRRCRYVDVDSSRLTERARLRWTRARVIIREVAARSGAAIRQAPSREPTEIGSGPPRSRRDVAPRGAKPVTTAGAEPMSLERNKELAARRSRSGARATSRGRSRSSRPATSCTRHHGAGRSRRPRPEGGARLRARVPRRLPGLPRHDRPAARRGRAGRDPVHLLGHPHRPVPGHRPDRPEAELDRDGDRPGGGRPDRRELGQLGHDGACCSSSARSRRGRRRPSVRKGRERPSRCSR